MRWWATYFSLLLVFCCAQEEWDASNFPNPTAGQFRECGMSTTANICDPDGVLSESARYRRDHDLKQLEARTRQDNAHDFCSKKGVTAAMAVAKHVRGGQLQAVKIMANDMLRRWILDEQCQKAVVFVVSVDDRKFWVARDDRVPVYGNEFSELFQKQKSLFQQKDYQQALTNILKGTWEGALAKKTPSRHSGEESVTESSTKGADSRGKQDDDSEIESPSFPALLYVIAGMVLACCLGCCAWCFCRGKHESGRGSKERTGYQNGPGYPDRDNYGGNGHGGRGYQERSPYVEWNQGGNGYREGSSGYPELDYQGRGSNQGRGGHAGGSGPTGRNAVGGIIGGIGGAGIGYLGGKILNHGGAGCGAFPMDNHSDSYHNLDADRFQPPPAYNDVAENGGLYPSEPVKDEGGGGSWSDSPHESTSSVNESHGGNGGSWNNSAPSSSPSAPAPSNDQGDSGLYSSSPVQDDGGGGSW